MQLEETILVMKFFFFLFIELGDLIVDLAPLLVHFKIQLFLSFIEAHVNSIFFLQIFRWFLLL